MEVPNPRWESARNLATITIHHHGKILRRLSVQDALRGLLQRYTATELFRCSVAVASAEAGAEARSTVGMDDLDELLLRSEVTLPLEVGMDVLGPGDLLLE